MLDGLLIHTLEVYRRSGRTDRFGQAEDQNPRQHTGDPTATYPCRVTRGTGSLQMQERAVDVWVTKYEVFLEPDADVLETDGVRVIGQNGEELMAMGKGTNKTIVYDGEGPHHMEFDVWSQRPAS